MARIVGIAFIDQGGELLQAMLNHCAQLGGGAVQLRAQLLVAIAMQISMDHGALTGAIQLAQGRDETLTGLRLDGGKGVIVVAALRALAQASQQPEAQNAVNPGAPLAQIGVIARSVLPQQDKAIAQNLFGIDAAAQYGLAQSQHQGCFLIVQHIQRLAVLCG